jgi:hydrophobic/amphiphilic exporter-1 (mainly G- bacteria), HAE1 family
MLASLILKKEHKPGKIATILTGFEEKQTALYKRSLEWVLRSKPKSLIIVVGSFLIFIIVMITLGPRLGFEFLSTMDDGKIKVEVELPVGYNLETTANKIRLIEEKIKVHPEVKHILTNLGKLSDLDIGTNMARMDIQLVDIDQREIGLQDMISVFVKELSDIPNAKIKVDVASGMGEGGAPVQFFLMGQEQEELMRYKDLVIERIHNIPGLINLDESSRSGKPEITVFPYREKLNDAGITITDLALTLRASVEGIQSAKYRELGDEYDITVTLNDESVNTPEKIGNITVATRNGSYRLSQLTDVRFTTGYTKILHRDKFTSIQFTGAPAADVPLGNITSEIDDRIADLELPPGYYIRWGGNVKMMNEMIADMVFAFFLAVLLTYMLLSAILENFLQPILIMVTVMLGLIGVIVSLFITGIPFNITSLMAIIMLIGIVVNNAILILDYTNQLRREQGYLPHDALLEAAPTKLKPQIMTSVAIVLGMLPLALGIGDAGKEMRMPLGVVAIGGLIASTILTLYVIPAFYNLTTRAKKMEAKEMIE